MGNFKSLFSKLLRQKQYTSTGHPTTKTLTFPTDLSTKFDLFKYLNFNIPELQSVKLSLDFDKQEKAFEQFFRYIKTRQTPVFMRGWWNRDEVVHTLEKLYPESVQPLLGAANNIVQHQFLLFSKHIVRPGPSIFWGTSYEEGMSTDRDMWEPGRTYKKPELLSDAQRDIHYVWALNRHQHFLDLGKAYWYTGEDAYVKEFMSEITTWIAQNPYPLSVNWVDEYEIALRGIFWIFGYTFFLPSDYIDEQFFCMFYQSLLFHGHATYDSLRRSSKSLRAHYVVAQAVFLYLLGTLFPEYLHHKTWSKLGWEILQWKTDLLTLDRIFQDSLAVFVNIIELYCLAFIVRKNNRYHIPQAMNDGLELMLEQLSLFMKPNGKLSRLGADHPTQLLKGMYHQTENFHYLFAMAAVLLNKKKFKALSKSFDEHLLWFFGEQGYLDFERLVVRTFPQESYLAPNASYAVMRSGWDEQSGYFLISTGMDKTGLSRGLRHTDLLSFELYADGYEYLVDSGPYSFNPTDAWNEYFRSMYAHNGIAVDRIKHVNFSDQYMQSSIDQWLSNPTFDFLSGYHTGFEDLEEPITHRRSIFYLKPYYWIVCDLLTGEGQHFFDQYFHFPPMRLNVDFMNKRVDIQTKQHHHFALAPLSPNDIDVTIFTGGETPDSGWISTGYKRKVEAPFIKYGKCARVPACFHTLLYMYHSEKVLNISARHPQVFSQDLPLLSDEVSALEISIEHELHYFVYCYQKHPQIQFDQFGFSGTLLFMKKDDTGIREIILHDATLLTMRDVVLFQSDTPIDALVLHLTGDALEVTYPGSCTFRMQLPDINQLFINSRRASIKREEGMLVISTSRV